MRPIRSLLLYLVPIVLAAALFGPWLYWSAQGLAQHWHAFDKLSQAPFHRYVHRGLLLFALLGLWPFLRTARIGSLRELGLGRGEAPGRMLSAGFALSFTSLACVAFLGIWAGARRFNLDLSASALLGRTSNAALSALVVAVLEEVVFRGALFGAFRKAHDWKVALFTSSAVYGLVHFFAKPTPPTEITWSSGLQMLPEMMRGFTDIRLLVPGLFILTLVGMILGLAYHQTGNLYFSIGLHAGWIFWLKIYGAVTIARAGANTWLWGSGKLIDGWSTLIIVGPVLLIMWLVQRNKPALTHAR